MINPNSTFFKTVRRLTIVAIVLAGTAFVLNLVIDNPYSHNLARRIINDKLQEYSGLRVDFRAVKVKAVPLGLDLFGFDVTSSQDHTKHLLKASQMRVRISLWAMVFGKISLGLVEATDLEVQWPLDPLLQDALGLNDPKESEPLLWPLPYQIPVELVQLKNARIYVELPPDPEDKNGPPALIAAFSQFDLRADIEDLRDIHLTLNAGVANIKAKNLTILENAKIETELNIAPDRIRKSGYRIEMPNMMASGVLSGKITSNTRTSILEHIRLQASISGKGDLSYLGKFLAIEDTSGATDIAGDVDVNIPVSDAKEEVTFVLKGEAKTLDGKIDGFRLRESKSKLVIDKNRLLLHDGNIIVGDKNYGDFSGFINFNDAITMEFTGKPKGLPFDTLMDMLKVENFDVVNAKLSSPDLKLVGRGDPFSLKVTATADFDDFVLGAMQERLPKDAPLPTCRSRIDLQIDKSKLGFNNSQLLCFTPNPKAEKGLIPSGSLVPPIDAQFPSLISLSGYASFADKTGIDLWLRSEQIDLKLLKGIIDEDASGFANATANIKGPYSKIGVYANLIGQKIKFREVPIPLLSSKVSLTNKDLLTWSEFSATFANKGSIKASQGSLLLNDALHIDTNVDVIDLDQETVSNVLRSASAVNVAFSVKSANGHIKGPLLKPGLYEGNLSTEINQFRFNDEVYFDSLTTKIVSDRSQIKTEGTEVKLKDLGLNIHGTLTRAQRTTPGVLGSDGYLGLNRKDRVKIDLKTVDSERPVDGRALYDHLQILPFVKSYASMAKISGQIEGSASVFGDLQELDASFDVRLANARYLESKIAPIQAKGDVTKGILTFNANQSVGALLAQFEINLNDKDFPYKWDIKTNRLDIRNLGTKYFANDPRNYAYLTANWKMHGRFTDWWHSKGELDLKDLRVRFIEDSHGDVDTIDMSLQEPLIMQMDDLGWRFRDSKVFKLANKIMNFQISTKENRPPSKLALNFDGQFNVEVLKSFIPDLETASGRIQAQGYLTGSVDKPEFELRVNDDPSFGAPVSLGLSSARPAFNDVKFDVRLTENALILNSFAAEKGKGRVTASGQIGLFGNQLETSRIDINLLNASFFSQVAVLKTFDSELSGNLSITGNKAPFLIAGDVQVSRARSTRNFDLREQIVNTLKRKSFETSKTSATADPFLNFDLRATADNSISIYNLNIQTTLSATLNITGTDIAPVITGQVEVDKGVFAYKYRRDFRITQGIITFDDPVRPDPRLDILAVSETAGYRVFMAITGRASDPRVDLSIDPPTREDGTPLTKVDILVLLSTGSLPERRRSDIATQDAAKAEAMNLLVGQFQEPVEKLFDMSGQTIVQQVYLDSYAGPDGSPTARLNLPLNVHEDWDVVFRVDNTTQRLSVGYRVDENVSVSGSLDRQTKEDNTSRTTTSDPTDTGVDLKFRFAFP